MEGGGDEIARKPTVSGDDPVDVLDDVPIAVNSAPAVAPDSIEIAWVRPPSDSYFARHWRGALPLGRSYWVNGVLATFALRALVITISRTYGESGATYAGVATT